MKNHKNSLQALILMAALPSIAAATEYNNYKISVTPTMNATYQGDTIHALENNTAGFITYAGGAAAGNAAVLNFTNSTISIANFKNTYFFAKLPATNFNSSSLTMNFSGSTATFAKEGSNGYMPSSGAKMTIGDGGTAASYPAEIELNLTNGSKLATGAVLIGNLKDANPHRSYSVNLQGSSGKVSSFETYTLAMYYGATDPSGIDDYKSESFITLSGYSTLKTGGAIIVSNDDKAFDGEASIYASGTNNPIDSYGNIQIGSRTGKQGGVSAIEFDATNSQMLVNGNLFVIGGANQSGGENFFGMLGDKNTFTANNNVQVGYGSGRTGGENEFDFEGDNASFEIKRSLKVGAGNSQSGGTNAMYVSGKNMDFKVGTESADDRFISVGSEITGQSGGTNIFEMTASTISGGAKIRKLLVGNVNATGGTNIMSFKGATSTPYSEISTSNIANKSLYLNCLENQGIGVRLSNQANSTVYNELRFDGDVGLQVNGGSRMNFYVGSDSGMKSGTAKAVLANTSDDPNCGNLLYIWGCQIGHTNATGGEAILEFIGSGSIFDVGADLKICGGSGTSFENPKGAHIIFKPSKDGVSRLHGATVPEVSGLITIDFQNVSGSGNIEVQNKTFFSANSNSSSADFAKMFKKRYDEGRFRVINQYGEEIPLVYQEATPDWNACFEYSEDELTVAIDLYARSAALTFIKKTPTPITINSNPGDISTYGNDSVYFSVNVTGYKPQYQWQFSADNQNWVDLEGENLNILEVPYASKDDEGWYRCVVSNPIDSKTSGAGKLTINETPVEVEPQDVIIEYTDDLVKQTVSANFTFTLKDDYKDKAESYQWYVNEYDYETKTYLGWNDVDAATSQTLVVNNIVPEINGNPVFNKNMYRCQIKLDDGGIAYTAPATLFVQTIKITDYIEENYNKYVGNPCNLAIAAKKLLTKTDRITCQWYINRNDGEGFVAIKGATSPSFNAYTKPESDGWQYYCEVTNGIDYQYSKTATVNVVAAPKLVSQSKKVAIFEGDETELKVNVEGGYDISYKWMRYNPNTKKWDYIEGATEPKYIVKGVAEHAGASFRCEVYETVPGTAPVRKFQTSAIKTPLEEAV
ncbi:MAG: immunoglobulin domain-containing protein, partial [Opitutales bacterium]|nr:immunoglobulin domain-containing protein [Opitutales bacterium]